MARHLAPDGRLITGFSLLPGRYDLDRLDHDAHDAGLVLEERWSTWSGDPSTADDDYAVSVFVRS